MNRNKEKKYKVSELYVVNIIEYEKNIYFGYEQYREKVPIYRIFQIKQQNGNLTIVDILSYIDPEYSNHIENLKVQWFEKITEHLKPDERNIPLISRRRLEELYYELNPISKPKTKILDINHRKNKQ